MKNTILSFLRFFTSIVENTLIKKSRYSSLEDIVNYTNYKDFISSSGQPTRNQLTVIKRAGYDILINLATYEAIDYPLKGEEAIVTRLGMDYVHIPVNMFTPTQRDFDQFVDTIGNAPGKKIWVHCAVGMRASAFLYKYRCSILGEEKQTAIWDLREIWEPFGEWKSFTFGGDPE